MPSLEAQLLQYEAQLLQDANDSRWRLARQVGFLEGVIKQAVVALRRGSDAQLVADLLETMPKEMPDAK